VFSRALAADRSRACSRCERFLLLSSLVAVILLAPPNPALTLILVFRPLTLLIPHLLGFRVPFAEKWVLAGALYGRRCRMAAESTIVACGSAAARSCWAARALTHLSSHTTGCSAGTGHIAAAAAAAAGACTCGCAPPRAVRVRVVLDALVIHTRDRAERLANISHVNLVRCPDSDQADAAQVSRRKLGCISGYGRSMQPSEFHAKAVSALLAVRHS
jgi:hypothetical protein